MVENKNAWFFEERSQCYEKIDIGKDVKAQVRLLAEATRELLLSQATLANKVVVSHDRIIEGLDYLASGIEDIREGMNGLKAAFEFSLSEVVWQIERNTRQLQDILKTLVFHLDTKGKDKRKRADAYYDNAKIDQAEEDFLALLELSEHDFPIYISMGMIYLFQDQDVEEALYYFDMALTYARQKSKYYASFALLYKAMILRDNGSVASARECLEEAIELSPDFCEPRYQMSLLEVKADKKRAISLVADLLEIDIRYALKIENEPTFLPIRKDLYELYNNRITTQSEAIQSQNGSILAEIQRITEQIEIYYTVMGERTVQPESEAEVHKAIQRVSELMERKSLIDLYTASRIMSTEVPRTTRKFKEAAYQHISEGIDQCNKEKYKIRMEHSQQEDAGLLKFIREGKNGVLTYSLIYMATFVMFRSLLASVLVAAVPFSISWFAQYRYHVYQQSLIKNIDGKIEKLVAIRSNL